MNLAVYPLISKLEGIERELEKLYQNYQSRLKMVESKLRDNYNPMLEREASNISTILTVISQALSIIRRAKSYVADTPPELLHLKFSTLIDEAEKLRDKVLYGSARIPTVIKAHVLMIYTLLGKASDKPHTSMLL
ncbi:hypothetical protein Pyrfu_0025 [Pyrolobus fumarii 1A]|uniref:Uncharacterized protein n=1 Tax=Pyrolobus fumarii (strain DSM 11204 / 1A) TaxID=694429 RepID=G0EDY1_PYRF1|nr:hypothetical protein [Pyrolobus fumarii]AEM37897.1 hypothetical protein Pyrfu_0025 [Pyrolobus fumarii 1A]